MFDKEIGNGITEELRRLDVNLHYKENSSEKFVAHLAAAINTLITKDFSRLISILYRLDISEKKLTASLTVNEEENAGDIIAKMIIERQIQKIEARRNFRTTNDMSDEEKW